MNLDLSLDGVSVSTDPGDSELAGHVRDTAESVRDLATYLAGESLRECQDCGERRPCRPVLAMTDQGPQSLHLCSECQQSLVEQELAAQREDADA